VDEDNSSHRTALHEAADAEHADITELLLRQSEVDPACRDNQDRTPYDIAYSKKNDEVRVPISVVYRLATVEFFSCEFSKICYVEIQGVRS